MLKRLDTLITQEGLSEKRLPKEIVMHWTEKTPNETETNRCRRISIVRGFAEYMFRLGYDAYIYPNQLYTNNVYIIISFILFCIILL